MSRWVFNLVTAIAGLLCLATLALLARSYDTYDTISKNSGATYFGVASAAGTCCVTDAPRGFRFITPPLQSVAMGAPALTPLPTGWKWTATPASNAYLGSDYAYWTTGVEAWDVPLGFHFGWNGFDRHLEIPYWFLAILFALIATGRSTLNLLQKLPTLPSEVRRKIRRAFRWLVIGVTTVAVVLPLAVLVGGYRASDGWDAVRGTPLIYLLFITLPIAGVLLAFATLRVQKLRLRMWGHRHLCEHCSYNLTGNTTGICPECGTAAASKRKLTA